jgi:hypothetical protein
MTGETGAYSVAIPIVLVAAGTDSRSVRLVSVPVNALESFADVASPSGLRQRTLIFPMLGGGVNTDGGPDA